jgi:hypothetical protein
MEVIFGGMHSPRLTSIDYHGQECKVNIVHPPRCYSSVKVFRYIFLLYTKTAFRKYLYRPGKESLLDGSFCIWPGVSLHCCRRLAVIINETLEALSSPKTVFRYCSFVVTTSSGDTSLGRPLGLQKVEDSRISRQFSHEGGMVVNPIHRPPLHPRRYPWSSLLLETMSS